MREYWQLMFVGKMHVIPASGNYLPPMLSHEALINSVGHMAKEDTKSRAGMVKRKGFSERGRGMREENWG